MHYNKKLTSAVIIVICCLLLLSGCSSTCKADGCENERMEDSKYCTEHICVEVDCLEGKVGENYCEKHFSCAVDECGNERVVEVTLCSEHKCVVEDCAAIKKGENYCEEHQCVQSGCEKPRKGTYYCEEHYKCAKCNEERNLNSEYCPTHKCRKCPNEALNNKNYCENHACSIVSCNNVVVSSSKYCTSHKCESCSEPRTGNSVYCKEHYKEEQDRIAAAKAAAEAKKDKVIVNRNGKKIWKVYMTDDEFRFKGTYTGTGNFIVTLLDDNQDYHANICNEIGDYIVDKTVSVTEGKYYYIETYCSDGRWSANWWGTYGN